MGPGAQALGLAPGQTVKRKPYDLLFGERRYGQVRIFITQWIKLEQLLPFPELAGAGAICGYSFILTSLDVSRPDKAAAAEHWYRHRTTVENLFRDSKLGAALRHLPSGYPQVNLAWMWGALLAAAMAAWLHQLTATALGEDIVHGHGVRGGKAMIATLRWRLIAVPGRLVRHARHLILRLPPGHGLLPEILARLRALPAPA